MFSSLAILSLALSAIPSVLGHGYVSGLIVDGQAFKDSTLNQPPLDTPIYRINDASPVKGANNPNIVCGPGAKEPKLVATVNPGSKIGFQWSAADGGNWPHNTGPMCTYLASCGNSCTGVDPSTLEWFKIECTLRDGSGQWAQAELMAGQPASITFPSNIVPGDYIIRHEIDALHLANTVGGAEYYPGCAQIKVTGSGTGRPTAAELVHFPGAFTDNDPGVFTQDAFNPQANFVPAGPPVAAFVNGGASGAAPANTGSTGGKGGKGGNSASGAVAGATQTGSSSAANPTGAAGAASNDDDEPAPGECRLVKKRRSTIQKKRSPAAVHADNVETYMPRHISRVMRSLKVRSLASSGMH